MPDKSKTLWYKANILLRYLNVKVNSAIILCFKYMKIAYVAYECALSLNPKYVLIECFKNISVLFLLCLISYTIIIYLNILVC